MQERAEFTEEPFDHFQKRVIYSHATDGSVKKREIYIPDEEGYQWHEAALKLFYEYGLTDNLNVRPETFVYGGAPGTDVLDNVLPHRDGELFYMVDIKDAYPSVDKNELLHQLLLGVDNWPISMTRFMKEFATVAGVPGLPLGAPASPYLFNLYLSEMDEALDAFCDEQGITYSRYFDDLTFSYPFKAGSLGEKARRRIRQIIESTPGMKVNPKKTRLHRRANAPVTITGVSLYPDGRIQAAPHIIRNAMTVFDEIDLLCFGDTLMTEYHQALINGHHGALVGMSQKPYSHAVRKAIARYQDVATMLHNTIALQAERAISPDGTMVTEDVSLLHRQLARQERLFTHARRAEIDDYTGEARYAQQIADYMEQFPDWEPELAYLMAAYAAPIMAQVTYDQLTAAQQLLHELEGQEGEYIDAQRERTLDKIEGLMRQLGTQAVTDLFREPQQD